MPDQKESISESDELVTAIRGYHEKMTYLALYGNIAESTWNRVVQNISGYPVDVLRLLNASLKLLCEKEWAEMDRIFNLPGATKEGWENYKILFDKPVLTEQKMMGRAAKRFRKAFRDYIDGVNNRLKALREEARAKNKPDAFLEGIMVDGAVEATTEGGAGGEDS